MTDMIQCDVTGMRKSIMSNRTININLLKRIYYGTS